MPAIYVRLNFLPRLYLFTFNERSYLFHFNILGLLINIYVVWNYYLLPIILVPGPINWHILSVFGPRNWPIILVSGSIKFDNNPISVQMGFSKISQFSFWFPTCLPLSNVTQLISSRNMWQFSQCSILNLFLFHNFWENHH